MKRMLVLLVATIVTMNLACKKDDDPSGGGGLGGAIIPLKVGNSWTFRGTFYDTLGGVLSIPLDDLVIRITRDTTIGSDKWFGEQGSWLINRLDGLWSRTSAGREYLVFKFPANVNDSYDSNGERVTVTATNQSVTVPQGQHSCYKYSSGGGSSSAPEVIQYCAPNVGLVKIEFYQRTLSGRNYLAGSYDLKQLTLN